MQPDIELKLRLSYFTQKEQRLLRPMLEKDGLVGLAEWTGQTSTTVLCWRKDGKVYSASRLVTKILQLCGVRTESDPGSALGPRFWELPDGRILSELADALGSDAPESGEALEGGGQL